MIWSFKSSVPTTWIKSGRLHRDIEGNNSGRGRKWEKETIKSTWLELQPDVFDDDDDDDDDVSIEKDVERWSMKGEFKREK